MEIVNHEENAGVLQRKNFNASREKLRAMKFKFRRI